MNFRQAIFLALKIFILMLVYMAGFVASSMLLMDMPMLTPPPMQRTLEQYALPLVSLVSTLVLAFVILRSRNAGWKLVGATFLILYGSATFMTQIESIVFPAVSEKMPPGFLPRLFLSSALLAGLFAPLSVWILGKFRRPQEAEEPNHRLVMPAREWAWKLAIIVAAYLILYFTFGYFVAWRNPVVRLYYGGVDPGSFFLQLNNILGQDAWLPFYQILRALLWTLIALPAIRLFKGSPLETGLAIGLCFAVLMNAQLLFPNPLMPYSVRMAHLLETAPSNFIFGLLIGALLIWRKHPG